MLPFGRVALFIVLEIKFGTKVWYLAQKNPTGGEYLYRL